SCFVRCASFLPGTDGERAAVELAARETGLAGHCCSSIAYSKVGERCAQLGVDRRVLRCSPFGETHDDHRLTARRSGLPIMDREVGKPPSSDLLVQLGELPRHCGRPVTKKLGHVGEAFAEPRGGFEEYQGRLKSGPPFECAAAGCPAWR